MTRWWYAALLLAVPVAGAWAFWIAPSRGWWFPPAASSYAGRIDHLFDSILVLIGTVFVVTELLLCWFVLRFTRSDPSRALHVHAHPRLELLWTIVPGLALLWVVWAQYGIWADIKFASRFPTEGASSIERPFAEVWATQFDWRMVYPGADGELGTWDDLHSPFDFAVPVGEPIVFRLRSRDVIHSFFVPAFRLKQDALPGHSIPVWFEATREGDFDLVCAELCGWGHYKMAGRVRVLSREGYDDWIGELEAHARSNGSEER